MATTATRRWWKRRDGSDDADADDLVPMDTQEQEELVRSLEQKQVRQSRRWRRVFAGFLLGYAAFLVYSSFHHAWSPWELRYHAYFMEDLPAPMVIIADWIAALSCLFSVTTTGFKLLQEVDVVFMLCQHTGSHLLDILPLEVTKNPMGCGVAPIWPFGCCCIELLCGPCATRVNARYQHIEELYV